MAKHMRDKTKVQDIINAIKANKPRTTMVAEEPENLLPFAQPQQEDPLRKSIAADRATGMSLSALSDKYELSVGALEHMESDPEFTDLVIKMQGVLDIPVETRVENASTAAYEKRYKLMMTSKDERIVEKVTEGFLDRKMGKAPAKLEVTAKTFNVTADLGQLDKDTDLVMQSIKAIELEKQKLLAS